MSGLQFQLVQNLHKFNKVDKRDITGNSTTRKIRAVQNEGNRAINRELEFYNLGAEKKNKKK